MPPTLKRSSTRYFPASVSPTNGSPLASSAVPSAGQRVVVSVYSVPQRGHFFIGGWCLLLLFAQLGSVASVSYRLRDRQKQGCKTQAVACGGAPKRGYRQ